MSALRQAALLTSVFVIVTFAAGAFALNELQREFNRRIETELSARFQIVASAIAANGFERSEFPSTALESIRFLAKGEQSRIREFRETGFFDDFDNRGDDHDRGDWLYLAGPTDGGQLIVGTNLGRKDEFTEVAFQSFAFVGLISAIIAGGLGLFLGFHNQNRISMISATLNRVAIGDLDARVHASHNRDDLDELAHHVDETTRRVNVLLRQTRDFSTNIAHDLKTPLARLRIRLENALLAESNHGDSEAEIASALEQTDHVIGIFDAFLRIAKLESGATKANFTKVDLADIARDVRDIYQAVIEDSCRSFATDISGSVVVQGDRVLLIQMLANMIENAIRHTPEGTAITLIVRPNEVGLADNGPGIPIDALDKVTQPLYRLETSRTTEGVGLGLSLVKTIADLHGADLTLSTYAKTHSGLHVRAEFRSAAKLTEM